jgi:drug/metabolite transporter (DMT)-like permease
LSSPAYTSTTRPLDALAASIVVVLCLSWGFNQVATKLAIHDIPPLTQAAVRSIVAALLISAWCRLRGIALLKQDGTLWFGLLAGILFAVEFILIFQGLLYTTASRATLFIYLAPFFVVLGARIVLPADRFSISQWLGLGLSFIGMVVAFGVPAPATDPKQLTRHYDGRRSVVLGSNHADHQGEPAHPRVCREGDALPACCIGAGYGRSGASCQ